MPARIAGLPRGHDHRVKMARHRPEALTLLPCDIAALLAVSVTAVTDRDHHLRPAMLGLKGRKTRRYSWAKYMAYLTAVGGADGD